jgi:dipeptidyl aminopeptidase/acylaminoacyl peptidase
LAGIQGIVATLPSVDLNRIYIMGTSAGGNGTHDFISADPDYFAAAISSAANPDKIDPTKRANLVNFNLWHMVGESDLDQNRYPGSVAFFNDMKSRNAKMKFTLFGKLGHSIGDLMIANDKIFGALKNGYKTENAGTDSDSETDTMKWLFSKSNDNNNTAVQTIKNDNSGMLIYFNKTNSMILWSANSNIDKVEVYSLSGTKMISISQPAISSIDLSSLKSGMYILRFYQQNLAAFSNKVVKNSR